MSRKYWRQVTTLLHKKEELLIDFFGYRPMRLTTQKSQPLIDSLLFRSNRAFGSFLWGCWQETMPVMMVKMLWHWQQSSFYPPWPYCWLWIMWRTCRSRSHRPRLQWSFTTRLRSQELGSGWRGHGGRRRGGSIGQIVPGDGHIIHHRHLRPAVPIGDLAIELYGLWEAAIPGLIVGVEDAKHVEVGLHFLGGQFVRRRRNKPVLGQGAFNEGQRASEGRQSIDPGR